MRQLSVYLSSLVLVLASTSPSYAYLDPGAGSMVLQILLGGVAAVGVILKLCWHKILALFGIHKDREGDIDHTVSDS